MWTDLHQAWISLLDAVIRVSQLIRVNHWQEAWLAIVTAISATLTLGFNIIKPFLLLGWRILVSLAQIIYEFLKGIVGNLPNS